jgi:hypothetical protein
MKFKHNLSYYKKRNITNINSIENKDCILKLIELIDCILQHQITGWFKKNRLIYSFSEGYLFSVYDISQLHQVLISFDVFCDLLLLIERKQYDKNILLGFVKNQVLVSPEEYIGLLQLELLKLC